MRTWEEIIVVQKTLTRKNELKNELVKEEADETADEAFQIRCRIADLDYEIEELEEELSKLERTYLLEKPSYLKDLYEGVECFNKLLVYDCTEVEAGEINPDEVPYDDFKSPEMEFLKGLANWGERHGDRSVDEKLLRIRFCVSPDVSLEFDFMRRKSDWVSWHSGTSRTL